MQDPQIFRMQDARFSECWETHHCPCVLLTLTTRKRRSKSRLIKHLGLGILCANLTPGFILPFLIFPAIRFPTNSSFLVVCIFISYLNTDMEPGEKQMNRWVNLLARVVSSSVGALHRIWLSSNSLNLQWDFLMLFLRGVNAYCQWVQPASRR